MLLPRVSNANDVCEDVARKVLPRLGMHLATSPLVVEYPENKYLGYTKGDVIVLRNRRDCETTVHEYIHYWQSKQSPTTVDNYRAREDEAVVKTRYVFETYSDLIKEDTH